MSIAAKTINIDALGYALATEAGNGVAQDEISLSASGSAVELTAGLTHRRKLFIKVLDGEGDVYVGSSRVTTSTGYLMRAQDELWLDVGPDVAVYGRAGATASKVRVLETSTDGTGAPATGGGTPAKVLNIDAGGHAVTTQAGSAVKQAQEDVNAETNAGKVELTAGLANRRKLYIKVMGDDVADQRFIYVAGADVVGGAPENSVGIPVWARYELVLDVGPDDELYALVNEAIVLPTPDPVDVRLLEIA